MVLETLRSPFAAEASPMKMLPIGFLYMTVAMFLSMMIFSPQASLVMVFLTTMAAIPLMYNTLLLEESKDMEGMEERWLMKEHAKALSFFMWLFVGIALATAFWYVVLPAETVSSLFVSQANTINAINSNVVEMSFSEKFAIKISKFNTIFFNNVKVLIFCVLFSFLYGAGAIFIMAWNASVVGVAIGTFIRNGMAEIAGLLGLAKIKAYFAVIGVGLLQYVLHGVPEILSFFTAGLAGGIISVAVIRHDYKTRKFEHVLLDAADLLVVSLILVFMAAVLEVFVTPEIFSDSVDLPLLAVVAIIGTLVVLIAARYLKRI